MSKADRIRIALFLFLGMSFLSAVFAVQGSLLNAMIDAFGLRASSQGTANATAFIGGILALVTAFFLQGRRQKRALLRATLALCSVSLVLLWLAPGYALFCTVWFVMGFGMAMMDTLLSACMADLYTGQSATRMMCILHTVFGLTSVLTPIGYQAMLSGGMPWKRVYLVIAICGAVLLVATAFVRRLRHIPDNEALSTHAVSLADISGGIRKGQLALLVAAMFFHGMFLSGLNTWINRYANLLTGRFAIPAQSCVFLGIMLSRLGLPFLPMKAEHYVRYAGLLGSIVLAVGLSFSGGLGLRIALTLCGLLFGALIPCILSLGCDRIRENTLLATTAMMLAMYAGQAISSPIIASLEAAFGLRTGIAMCAVCMALTSGCCLVDGIKARNTAR